jgi:hypothetical protein
VLDLFLDLFGELLGELRRQVVDHVALPISASIFSSKRESSIGFVS